MSSRSCFPVAVQAVLLDEDEHVLLLRRTGTGYRDGWLGLPAGHLEAGEDAVSGLLREVAEEVGLELDREDCRLAVTVHCAPEGPGDREYLHLFFLVRSWRGTPLIGEPDRCSELVRAPLAAVPPDCVDHVAAALAAVRSGQSLVLHGWGDDLPAPPGSTPRATR